MAASNKHKPLGPPPPWLANVSERFARALAEHNPNQGEIVDLPEGTSLDDVGPEGVVAAFVRKQEKEQTDGND